jgi:enolase-phosphatase E1
MNLLSFSGRGIVLDIEGTMSSILYVRDVMFKFARRELNGFLASHWDEPGVRAICERIVRESGTSSLEEFSSAEAREKVAALAGKLMDEDFKTTGLKDLQALIWESGFKSGELRGQVYPDVPPVLAAWNRAGKDVRVYSSGSIAAQKLFFENTADGNLLPFFKGHFDTTTGSKKAAESYRKIGTEMKLPPREILFLSDIEEELNAAQEAGMVTGLVVRPESAANQPGQGGIRAGATSRHGGEQTTLSPDSRPVITNFSQIIWE